MNKVSIAELQSENWTLPSNTHHSREGSFCLNTLRYTGLHSTAGTRNRVKQAAGTPASSEANAAAEVTVLPVPPSRLTNWLSTTSSWLRKRRSSETGRSWCDAATTFHWPSRWAAVPSSQSRKRDPQQPQPGKLDGSMIGLPSFGYLRTTWRKWGFF